MQPVLVVALVLMSSAVLGFFVSEWRSPWRTRRSGPPNNWQNEGYMANQDGMSWSEIDGTIVNSAPPQRADGSIGSRK